MRLEKMLYIANTENDKGFTVYMMVIKLSYTSFNNMI